MITNVTEVKKVMSDFNSISNRLLQATYDDYLDVLKKMLNFIESTEIIKGFIDECGGFDKEIESSIDNVIQKNCPFKFSIDDKAETSEIYSIVKVLCEGNYELLPYELLFAYSYTGDVDDKLNVFNHRVVFILINHINNFLKKVGYDMGMDNNVTFNINGTMVNVANDNATINAVQNNNGINTDELKSLISAMRESLDSNLPDEDKAEANECIDEIEAELSSAQPNEKSVKDKFRLLKRIDSGVKFASACCSLLTFAHKAYPFIAEIIPKFQELLQK